MLKSIRSRLALSFAGIALMTTFALGVVLLVILQNYYAQLELDYLRGNAQAASNLLSEVSAGDLADDEVQWLIENLAFLSQTRIEVFGAESQLLYDSGSPQYLEVNLGSMPRSLTQTNNSGPKYQLRIITVDPISNTQAAKVPISSTSTANAKVLLYRSTRAGGSPFGFTLGAGAASSSVRSHRTVTEPVLDLQNGGDSGSVTLSEGPALSTAILTSVAWGWALASAVAVLLAAGVGGYISRRISAPVLALTAVTTRMAQGELSSRANLTDLTSRDEFGQLARSFNEMAEQVETTVTTLHRFVADAAHELHTPLTALRANLDLAAQEHDAAAQHIFVERAQTTVLRLEALTNNLLDLSRLEAQTEKEPAPPLDLAALLRQATEVYASQAEQAGLTFALHIADEPLWIRAYAKQVYRALNNLFDNACKFTPAGGAVAIQLQRQGSHVQLSVSDSGIGIPPDDLAQVFNRFHRSRNTTDCPGSGLGLAIVKAITEQQGGQVFVENSAPGARFTLQWDALPNGADKLINPARN